MSSSHFLKRILLASGALLSVTAAQAQETGTQDLDAWITDQYRYSYAMMKRNIHPRDTVSGVVIASPSRENPNYFFHWVRDAALVMETLHGIYIRTQDSDRRDEILSQFRSYALLSRRLQETPTRSGGHGEPKFNVDASAFNGDWARPQNDGPALRAISLIAYAKSLIAAGQLDDVREFLYDGQSPSSTVIKSDLDFVSLRWADPTVDLWEEVRGDHFYTRMVQRRALIEGADLAETLGDFRSADRYKLTATAISKEIEMHWNSTLRLLIPTLNRREGIAKPQNLDAAILLGVLHGDHGDGFFAVNDDRVLATLVRFKNRFQNMYAINQREGSVGVALGRYPEDTYDGLRTDGLGNPWFLITLGYGEFLYKLEAALRHSGRIRISSLNQAFFQDLVQGESYEVGTTIDRNDERFSQIMGELRRQGDAQMQRVKDHVDQNDGAMSEQFNRRNGFMQGAPHLTWSYASFLTAFWARQSVLRMTML